MKLYQIESLILRVVSFAILAMALTAATVQGQLANGVTVMIANDTAIVRWQGTPGVKYRVERSVNGSTWQGIDAPTIAFAETNILIASALNTSFRVATWSSADPKDTRSPSVPNGITVQTPACDQATLSWNAASDVGGGATGLREYLIYRGGAFLECVASPILSADDTSVVGARTYAYQIAAMDEAGNVSARSIAVNATMPACVCTYTIAASASPSAGGSVSGGGMVNCGSSVTLLATAASCYKFANWTEGGTVVSSSASYTSPAGANRALVANFAPLTYSLSTDNWPANGGSTGGGGTVNCGSSVTVTCSANAGYTFANWMENGVVVSSSPSFTFTTRGDRSLTAKFTAVSPTAPVGLWTFDAANVSGTTVTDTSGNSNDGALAGNILPALVAGRKLDAVNLDGTSGKVTIPDSGTLNVRGPFTVSAWVNFSSLPGPSHYPSIVAKLASPAGYSGYGMLWDGSGVAGIVGPGTATWHVTSSYAPTVGVWNHYAVVFDGSNLTFYVNGAVYSQVPAAAPGDTAGVPVLIGPHYSEPASFGYFGGKVDDVRIYSGGLTASDIAQLYTNVTSCANSIITKSSPANGGSSSGGGTVDCTTSVTVTATPAWGYTFANWTEGGTVVSSAASYVFTANGDRTLLANFVFPAYSIVTSSSPASGGSTSGGGTVNSGDSVTVTATPASCYTFLNWTEGGTVVSSSPSYTFTASGNRTLVANFSLATYAITTSSSPSAGGSASGGGTKNCGTSVTATATAASGYTFLNWTDGGTVVSSSPSYTFTASGNRTLVANFSAVTYSIATSSSPASGGSTSGGGTVNSGASVTVTATPATCYTFLNWTDGGTVVSSSPSYTFTASGNRTLVANFSLATYVITTSSSPSAGGSGSGGGTKNCGTSVTVTATAASGYTFLNWTDAGTVVSSSPSYTFTVGGNRTLVANFSSVTYSIATSSSPASGGSTSGGGAVNSGASVTVTATPASCYTFLNWTEGGTVVSSSPSYTFTASGNRTLVANFSLATYAIATGSSPSAGGSASGGGTKNCGTSVTATATAASGYTFLNWTDGGTVVSSLASYTFTASGNRTLVANFSIVTYSIATSSSPASGGSTSGGGAVNSGASVTVTATPASCYTFLNWTDGGTVVSSSPSYTFTASGNRTLVANFSLATYAIATSSSPSAGGSASGGGTKNCGTSVTATATAASGYTFLNWTDGGTVVSSLASYTFTASGNRTLVANFSIVTYSIATSSSPASGGSTSGGGAVNSGASVTVTATPASCYSFVNWTEGGTVVSSAASYTFTVSGNRILVANFTPATYTISTGSLPTAGGSASGGGAKNCGSSVTVTATPASCYSFVNWTEGGTVVSSAASYTFTATGNRTLAANFAARPNFTIATSSSPANGGSTGGGGTVNCGSSVTLTATPSAGYSFMNWTEGGTVVSSAAGFTFTANTDRNLTANFQSTAPDTTAPAGNFLAPSPAAVLAGQVSLQVRCTDNQSLSRASFYIDNNGQWRLLGTSTSSGMVFTNTIVFDTTTAPNGPHTLLTMVYDVAGNASSAMVGVSIANVLTDPGVSLWLNEVGRSTLNGEAVGNAVKADGQGNVFVVGNFKGSVNFGTVAKTALGGTDIFVCKFATNGNMLWVKTFGGISPDNVTAIAVDASGNLLITGYFFGTANFGGTDMTSGDGIYGSDIFVAKYSNEGNPIWSKRLGGRFGNNSSAGIAVDSSGDVIVGGVFYTEVDLGNGSLILSRAGSSDAFVAKFAGQTGAYIWAKDFGGIGSDYVKGVAVDSLGNVVVVGYGYESMDFGGGMVPNVGSADLYIAKYAGVDGHYLWSRTAGGSGPDTAEGVAVDKDGNIFVTGAYYNSVDLGGVTLTPPFDTGIYLAKYNPAGLLQWARGLAFETAGGSIGVRAVAADSSGNVAITGNATGAVDFGNGVSTYGDVNFYLAKYGPQGGYLWAKRSASVGWCGGYGLATDLDRNVISTGSIQGDVNVDGMLASSPGLLIKSGFLMKISP